MTRRMRTEQYGDSAAGLESAIRRVAAASVAHALGAKAWFLVAFVLLLVVSVAAETAIVADRPTGSQLSLLEALQQNVTDIMLATDVSFADAVQNLDGPFFLKRCGSNVHIVLGR